MILLTISRNSWFLSFKLENSRFLLIFPLWFKIHDSASIPNPDNTCHDLWIALFSFSLSELLLLPSLYNTMCYKTLKIDNWWMLKTAIVCFKNIKMLLNIAHEEKGQAKNVGSSSKWLLGIFQDGRPLIPRPSLFSKMATESNFSPSQGIAMDVKIPTWVELHKVKFPWGCPPSHPPSWGKPLIGA